MNLIEIFSIILIHWFADFVLQTDKQAKGKSSSWKYLLGHTFSYSLTWFTCCIIYAIFHVNTDTVNHMMKSVFEFTAITFVAHTITDYYTSRLNSQLWKEGKVHNFFVSVGFDQVLHYVQLFTTYYYLTQ